MADWARVTLPARGKIRRFIEGRRRTGAETEGLRARREGDGNRGGACGRIVFRGPFPWTDAQGEHTRRIHPHPFTQRRLFPMHEKDLLALGDQCGCTFAPVAEGAPLPAPD